MGLFDGFESISVNTDRPFISLSKYGVTFSKSSVEMLGYPSHVKPMLNREKKQFAIIAADGETNASPFVKNEAAKTKGFVRWNQRSLVRNLGQYTNVENILETGIRVNGQYYPEENAIIYNLTDTQPLSSNANEE